MGARGGGVCDRAETAGGAKFFWFTQGKFVWCLLWARPGLGHGVRGCRQTPAFRQLASAGGMLGVLECFLENMNWGFCAEIWGGVWVGEGPMGG